MNEFKDLQGKPLEKLPYESKPIPTKLEEVENNHVSKGTKLRPSDYWNMIFAVLSDYALSKLDVTSQNKVLSFRSVLTIIGAGIVILLFIYLFRS